MRPNGFIRVSTTKHRELCTRARKRKSLTMRQKSVTYISPLFVQNNWVHCKLYINTHTKLHLALDCFVYFLCDYSAESIRKKLSEINKGDYYEKIHYHLIHFS